MDSRSGCARRADDSSARPPARVCAGSVEIHIFNGLLGQELSLNPTGQTEFRTQVDSLLAIIGKLSDADYVRSIIRQGESKTIEFKQTFSLDIRKDTKEHYIEASALKTLVAFLNSDGGILLVGVGDDETIVGINVEIKKFHKDSLDNFLKHFKNNLKSRIGEAFYPFINYRILDVEGRGDSS